MMTKSKTWIPLALVSAIALAGCGGGGSGPGDPRIAGPNDSGDNNGENNGGNGGGDGGGNVGGDQETFCTSPDTVFEVAEFVPADGEQGVAPNRSLRGNVQRRC